MLEHFYCKYNLMAPYQTLITPDMSAIKIGTPDFINSLLLLVHDYENYDIRLEGNNDFLKGLAKQILNFNKTHYKITPQIIINGGHYNE